MHFVMRHSVLETLLKNHANCKSNYCGLLKRHKKNYDKKKSYDIDEADGKLKAYDEVMQYEDFKQPSDHDKHTGWRWVDTTILNKVMRQIKTLNKELESYSEKSADYYYAKGRLEGFSEIIAELHYTGK